MEWGAESSRTHKAPGPGAASIYQPRPSPFRMGASFRHQPRGSNRVQRAGNISVLANQSVTLSNGGSIVADSTGPANAGNIAINAGAQFLSQNGTLSTTANQASGGNITVQATDSIRLISSQLSTSVQGGPQYVRRQHPSRSGHRHTPKQPGHGPSGAGRRRQHQHHCGDVPSGSDERRQRLIAVRVERRREYSVARVEFEQHAGDAAATSLASTARYSLSAVPPR